MRIGLYHYPPMGISGAIGKVIVGTHLLVSTPASAKAMVTSLSIILDSLAIRNLPAEDWLGIIPNMHQDFPEFTRF